jgi:hypothetical protein
MSTHTKATIYKWLGGTATIVGISAPDASLLHPVILLLICAGVILHVKGWEMQAESRERAAGSGGKKQ